MVGEIEGEGLVLGEMDGEGFKLGEMDGEGVILGEYLIDGLMLVEIELYKLIDDRTLGLIDWDCLIGILGLFRREILWLGDSIKEAEEILIDGRS